MDLGYAIVSFIFIGIFAASVVAQICAKAFHPFLYWVTIVDNFGYNDDGFRRSFARHRLFRRILDFVRGAGCLPGRMALVGRLHLLNTVATPRVEMFYWVAILLSQTLG